MQFKTAQNKKHKLALMYLLIAALVWGAAGPVIKFTLIYLPPFTFLFLRFLTASIVILPFLILEERKHPVIKKDWVNLIVLSLLGGAITLAFVFFGFKYTTSLDGSLISAVSPILTLAASSKLLKEKITENEKNGAIIALCGTLVVTMQPLLTSFFHPTGDVMLRILGNVFILLSIVSWIGYTLWSKKVFEHKPSRIFNALLHYFHLRSETKQYSPFFLTGVLSVVSLIALAPLSFLELGLIHGFKYPSFENLALSTPTLSNLLETPNAMIYTVLGVLYMGLFSTLIAYGLYEWAIKEIPVAESAIFAFLQPTFAIPFAYLLLSETVDLWFVVGASIIGYGFYVSEKKVLPVLNNSRKG